mmetsp:Transcript_17639/g.48054  ORF Transcript_17639/g.48054 Transcript_17639/m.48054 type:complete len:462 (-) Transcript_17639:335-1720(-)
MMFDDVALNDFNVVASVRAKVDVSNYSRFTFALADKPPSEPSDTGMTLNILQRKSFSTTSSFLFFLKFEILAQILFGLVIVALAFVVVAVFRRLVLARNVLGQHAFGSRGWQAVRDLGTKDGALLLLSLILIQHLIQGLGRRRRRCFVAILFAQIDGRGRGRWRQNGLHAGCFGTIHNGSLSFFGFLFCLVRILHVIGFFLFGRGCLFFFFLDQPRRQGTPCFLGNHFSIARDKRVSGRRRGSHCRILAGLATRWIQRIAAKHGSAVRIQRRLAPSAGMKSILAIRRGQRRVESRNGQIGIGRWWSVSLHVPQPGRRLRCRDGISSIIPRHSQRRLEFLTQFHIRRIVLVQIHLQLFSFVIQIPKRRHVGRFGLILEKRIVQRPVVHIHGAQLGRHPGAILLLGALPGFLFVQGIAQFGNARGHDKIGQSKGRLFKAPLALQVFAFATPVAGNGDGTRNGL